MKKTTVLWIILDLIFLIIFNAVFFLIGGVNHNLSVWLSYGFIHFAYFMLLFTPLLIRGGKSAAVFGFSLYSISSVYFLVEFAIGIVFVLISPESYKIALLVQLCLAGLFGIILISNMIANEHTADNEKKRQCQIEYVKKASTKIKVILDRINDKEERKKVEMVYDAINSSPVKSHPNMEEMESRILILINELDDAVSKINKKNTISLADTLLSAVNERNICLRNMN